MLSSNTEDSVSDSISIPGGFPFGNNNQSTVYVRPDHSTLSYARLKIVLSLLDRFPQMV